MTALLVVAFLVVPLLELYVILQVAAVIGGWQTIAVLVVESVVGAWLVRREGRKAWRRFERALAEHRAPAREVADGALVLAGGVLLLTPGFLTDVVAFLLLLPLTRPLARRALTRALARRLGTTLAARPGPPASTGTHGVVEGEVLRPGPPPVPPREP